MARTANVKRKTNETDISVDVEIDGSGRFEIETGVGFFDHMLEQLSKHSLIDMNVMAKGDLHIDDHHNGGRLRYRIGPGLEHGAGRSSWHPSLCFF